MDSSLREFFQKLGVELVDQLFFHKKKGELQVKKAWLSNQDPTHTFLFKAFEKEIKEKKYPPLQVRYVNSSIGYGLFTKERIGKHRLIGEYVGVVKKRTLFSYFFNPYCVRYRSGLLRTYVIDASKKGNITRFINHSKDPNVEMRSSLGEDGLMHVYFLSKRVILEGEEILLDYGNYLG